MKVTSELNGKRLVISVSGELDQHYAGDIMRRIEDKLEEYEPRDCVLDLGGLSFMDSSGIAVILRTYKRVNASGGRLVVENVPPQPMRVLDASGLDRLIKISAII